MARNRRDEVQGKGLGMGMKLVVAGFRHGHIMGLYNLACERDDIDLVAACEEDADARRQMTEDGKAEIAYDDFDEMLDRVECDVVAIGDYFAKRGSLAIKALERGKHVICDKPLCTRLDELDEIERLSGEKGLKVGLMLDLRNMAPFIGLRKMVREGLIGPVHAVCIGGQHPLSLGSRPGWYFEPDKHGGTITDIGIHAMDVIPWITGLKFSAINAARCWNAFASDYPHFKDGAQVMLTMDNGCGVLGDFSYFMPDDIGYSHPGYWRTTLFGRTGTLETAINRQEITLAQAGVKELASVPLPPGNPGGYFESFLRDIRGEADGEGPTTESVLAAMRTVVMIQKAADTGAREVVL